MVTSASGLSKTTTTDLDGNGTTDLSQTDVMVLNADGSTTETLSDFKSGGTVKDRIITTMSADGLSITTQYDDDGSGSPYDRTTTDVTTHNADGSTTEVISNLNLDGSLHNKTTIVTTADQSTTTTTIDVDGNGTADQTIVQKHNLDGTALTLDDGRQASSPPPGGSTARSTAATRPTAPTGFPRPSSTTPMATGWPRARPPTSRSSMPTARESRPSRTRR